MAFKPSVLSTGTTAHNIVPLVFNSLMCFKGDSGVKSDKMMQSQCDNTGERAGLLWKSWGFEKLKECVDFKFIVKIKTPTQSLQERVCINFNF